MKSRTRMRLENSTIIDCGQQRQKVRSISWNSTGSWLVGACNDRLAKIWTVEGSSSQGREVLAVSGHSAPVDRARFHPNEASWLCTSAQDRTVRIWDVRAGSQRSMGRIDVMCSPRLGTSAASVEWCGSAGSSLLVVTERDDSVYIYDVRKLAFSTTGGRASSASPLHSFPLKPNRVESTIFSPSGKYLVAGTSFQGEAMGEVRIWEWQTEASPPKSFVYPGHTGPIFSHVFSPDGKRLATGGSDAIVGLWDVASMVCTDTITRRTKFIRSVSFSHDSKLVASSSEEDGIDLADASANGDFVGKVGRGGADEVSFHPKAPLLAWARSDVVGGPPPVAVAKLTIAQ